MIRKLRMDHLGRDIMNGPLATSSIRMLCVAHAKLLTTVGQALRKHVSSSLVATCAH